MTNYLDKYEANLMQLLLSEITSAGYSGGQLLGSSDIDEKWDNIAPDYVIDAVPEIASYPLTSLGWAAYVGVGVAALWDKSWEKYRERKDIYSILKGSHSFDYMDEYIREELLMLEPGDKEYHNLEDIIRLCSERCLSAIRRENIEPLSLEAFYIFSRSVKVMYQIGASLGLKLLNYGYHKVDLGSLNHKNS